MNEKNYSGLSFLLNMVFLSIALLVLIAIGLYLAISFKLISGSFMTFYPTIALGGIVSMLINLIVMKVFKNKLYTVRGKLVRLTLVIAAFIVLFGNMDYFRTLSGNDINAQTTKNESLPEEDETASVKRNSDALVKERMSGADVALNLENIQKPPNEYKNEFEDSISESEKITIDAIVSLMNDDPVDDWSIFLDKHDTLPHSAPELSSVFLVKALRVNAPLDVVIDLLNRGAQMTDDHVQMIVLKRTVEHIQELENYGLDLVGTSSRGVNLLSLTLLSKQRDSLFDYLIDRGVAVENEQKSYLLEVLEQSEKLRLGPKYVIKMIDNGAVLGKVEREWISDIKDKNKKFYLKLQKHFDV